MAEHVGRDRSFKWEYHVSYRPECPAAVRFNELAWHACSTLQNDGFTYIWRSMLNAEIHGVGIGGFLPTYPMKFQRGHYSSAKYVIQHLK